MATVAPNSGLVSVTSRESRMSGTFAFRSARPSENAMLKMPPSAPAGIPTASAWAQGMSDAHPFRKTKAEKTRPAALQLFFRFGPKRAPAYLTFLDRQGREDLSVELMKTIPRDIASRGGLLIRPPQALLTGFDHLVVRPADVHQGRQPAPGI